MAVRGSDYLEFCLQACVKREFLSFPSQKASRYSEMLFSTEFVQFYISPKALRYNGVLLGQYPFCHLGLRPTGAAVEVLYFHETVALN